MGALDDIVFLRAKGGCLAVLVTDRDEWRRTLAVLDERGIEYSVEPADIDSITRVNHPLLPASAVPGAVGKPRREIFPAWHGLQDWCGKPCSRKS